MGVMETRIRAGAVSLIGCALILTNVAAADLVRLADILAPVLTAQQFAVLCRAADPRFEGRAWLAGDGANLAAPHAA
jgi:hypothetical protein